MDRPLASGQTDSYTVALQFAPPASAEKEEPEARGGQPSADDAAHGPAVGGRQTDNYTVALQFAPSASAEKEEPEARSERWSAIFRKTIDKSGAARGAALFFAKRTPARAAREGAGRAARSLTVAARKEVAGVGERQRYPLESSASWGARRRHPRASGSVLGIRSLTLRGSVSVLEFARGGRGRSRASEKNVGARAAMS